MDELIEKTSQIFGIEEELVNYIISDAIINVDKINVATNQITNKYTKYFKPFRNFASSRINDILEALIILSTNVRFGEREILFKNDNLSMKMFFDENEIIITFNYYGIRRHIRLMAIKDVLMFSHKSDNVLDNNTKDIYRIIGKPIHNLDSFEYHCYKNDCLVSLTSFISESDVNYNVINSFNFNIDFVGADAMSNYYVCTSLNPDIVFNGKKEKRPSQTLLMELNGENSNIFDADYLEIDINEATNLRKFATDNICKDCYDNTSLVNKVLRDNTNLKWDNYFVKKP